MLLSSRNIPIMLAGLPRLKRILVQLAFVLIASWIGIAPSSGASADLVPLSVSDGICAQTTVAEQPVWQNTGNSSFLYFRRPDNFAFTAGQTLYVRATYYDEGGGKVGMQYDGQAGAFTHPAVHTRTSRVGTGKFVDGYFELTAVNFARRENGQTDFRLSCGAPGGIPVSVHKVTLQDVPFPDPDFQLAISRPWMTRYTGAARDYVDTTTLKDKVMVGYQGWFRTPNDLDDNGWFHWCGNNTMSPANFNTDMWPELTAYDPATLHRAGNVVTRSGQPAHVFSSTSLVAVRTHFRWMRKHNIDGAFVQRFGPQAGAQPEWVLRNISQAAAEEGITWAIEYDVSGMANATVAAKLQADWEWLTTQFGLLDDPRYAHENGRPVVFIWGFPFADRGFTTPNANAAVDYFLNQGAYVIGGIPNIWTTLDADWQAHILKYNGILVWQNQGTSDGATFRNRGQDFFPHVWPGFSWANLTKTPANPPTAYTDRNGGQFYWTLGRNWIQSGGADRLFVSMFDEYDEGTAIMPMSDDPPNPPAEYGRFIDNQGKPSDWWMMLTDELKRMMLSQRTNTNTLPTVASLANRSNTGNEASVDLGASDLASSLSFVDNGDGHTVVESVGGKESRGNLVPATDLYMYFNVANGFAWQMPAGDITVEVEYHDAATSTVLGLQYDSTTAAYKNHPQTITTTGSNRWRRVRFEIPDAYLGGRQNNGADFRLTFGGKKLNVNRVWVRLPEENAYPFTWQNTSPAAPLDWSQGANWLGGVIAPSSPLSTVRFFPGQTLTGGAVSIVNSTVGREAGVLKLGGNASATTAVLLTGGGLHLGGTAPAIALDATDAALSYDISAALTLTGATTIGGDGSAAFRVSGPIGGAGGIHKTGSAALILEGSSNYAGATSVAAGTLEVNGSIGGTSLDIAGGAVLSGNGTIHTPATIHGIHRPGLQTFSGPLAYAAGGLLEWSLKANTSAGPGTNFSQVSGTLVAATAGASVKVILDSPQSTVDLADPFWSLPRSWPVLSASGGLTGTFVLGIVSPDSHGLPVTGDLGSFVLAQSASALSLTWTPALTYAKWAALRFGGTAENPEIAGKTVDPDHDGVSNLLEYALAMDPVASDIAGLPAAGSGSGITFTYTRPANPVDLSYQVQWSADLSTWSADGVAEEIVSDDGTLRSIKATVPPGGAQRFLRLKVTSE